MLVWIRDEFCLCVLGVLCVDRGVPRAPGFSTTVDVQLRVPHYSSRDDRMTGGVELIPKYDTMDPAHMEKM